MTHSVPDNHKIKSFCMNTVHYLSRTELSIRCYNAATQLTLKLLGNNFFHIVTFTFLFFLELRAMYGDPWHSPKHTKTHNFSGTIPSRLEQPLVALLWLGTRAWIQYGYRTPHLPTYLQEHSSPTLSHPKMPSFHLLLILPTPPDPCTG